jgi:hypothetical protein
VGLKDEFVRAKRKSYKYQHEKIRGKSVYLLTFLKKTKQNNDGYCIARGCRFNPGRYTSHEPKQIRKKRNKLLDIQLLMYIEDSIPCPSFAEPVASDC